VHIFSFDWNVFVAEIQNSRDEQANANTHSEEQTIGREEEETTATTAMVMNRLVLPFMANLQH
jgi:hypothetical protein